MLTGEQRSLKKRHLLSKQIFKACIDRYIASFLKCAEVSLVNWPNGRQGNAAGSPGTPSTTQTLCRVPF